MGICFYNKCCENYPNIYSITTNNHPNSIHVNLEVKIKSKYILKKILYNLNEEKKLYLARYNKFYSNLLGITSEQYKNLSGRIKIGGINGYGKEYELKYMYLIFKGFYLNGKRNGRGKVHDDREYLIFEGDYLKGKKMEEELNIMIMEE